MSKISGGFAVKFHRICYALTIGVRLKRLLANKFGLKAPNIHHEDGFGPGESPENQPFRRVVARRLLLANSTVVVPSRVLESVALKKWKIKRDQLHYVSPMASTLNVIRNRPPRTVKRCVIGSVGALRPEKNYQRLINAFSESGAAEKSDDENCWRRDQNTKRFPAL